MNHGPEEAARSEHAGFESQIFLPLALPRIFSKTRGGEKADRTVFSQNKNDSPASLENNLKLPGREQRVSPCCPPPRPQLGCISLSSGWHLGVPTCFVLQVAKIQHSQGLEGQVPNPGAGQRPKRSSSSGPPLLEAALALRTGLPGLGCVGGRPRPPQTPPRMKRRLRARPVLTGSCRPPRARPPRRRCRWRWSRCLGGPPSPWLGWLCRRGPRPPPSSPP